jgi:hypothetical protein
LISGGEDERAWEVGLELVVVERLAAPGLVIVELEDEDEDDD